MRLIRLKKSTTNTESTSSRTTTGICHFYGVFSPCTAIQSSRLSPTGNSTARRRSSPAFSDAYAEKSKKSTPMHSSSLRPSCAVVALESLLRIFSWVEMSRSNGDFVKKSREQPANLLAVEKACKSHRRYTSTVESRA